MTNTMLRLIKKEDISDMLFFQVMPLIRNIDDNIDTHLYHQFTNGNMVCFELLRMGTYSLVYIKNRKELVITFRLENDGSWGSGEYFKIDNEDLFPPTIVKEALITFVKRVGLTD